MVNFEKHCRFRWEHPGDWMSLCTETVLGKEMVDPEREGILTKVPPTLDHVKNSQELSGIGTTFRVR